MRRSSGAGGDPLSASQKIAEMGLSRGASEVVAPTESEKQRDFGAIVNDSAAQPDYDDDSDDLF